MNAPIASDKPKLAVTYAADRPRNTMARVKISRFLSAASRSRTRGTTSRPPSTSAATTARLSAMSLSGTR